jgi:hypothetical protein
LTPNCRKIAITLIDPRGRIPRIVDKAKRLAAASLDRGVRIWWSHELPVRRTLTALRGSRCNPFIYRKNKNGFGKRRVELTRS